MAASRRLLGLGMVLLTGTAVGPAGAADGAAAFDAAKCGLCHAVAAAGIEAKSKSAKMAAPDLSGYKPAVGSRELAAYLRKQSKLGDSEHRLSFKGSDEELQTILDWLGSLEATQ